MNLGKLIAVGLLITFTCADTIPNGLTCQHGVSQHAPAGVFAVFVPQPNPQPIPAPPLQLQPLPKGYVSIQQSYEHSEHWDGHSPQKMHEDSSHTSAKQIW